MALAFLLPTTYLTLAANLYAREAGVLGRAPSRRGPAARRSRPWSWPLLALALRLWPARRLRPGPCARSLPFLVCILIYTNLHDTIGFVNPHDVHHGLDRPRPVALRRRARASGRSASSRRAHRGDDSSST